MSHVEQSDMEPHEFVRVMMNAWESMPTKPDRSVHGKYFEYVIGESLAQKGVRYLYHQADVLHVPLATFDWFLYHETHPVSISCKTKARDRWKQAALEASALKRVYVKAVNYLVTIERVPSTVEKKVRAPLSIDHYVVANHREYSDAVKSITQREYSEAIDRSPIHGGSLVAINQ